MKRILNSALLLFAILAIPSYDIVKGLIYHIYPHGQMMYLSGVYSVYLLVVTLAITPAATVLKRMQWGLPIGRWLIMRRRYFGLGCFYYASLHMLHYVDNIHNLKRVIYEAGFLPYAIGWGAFFVFLILAITSNTLSLRILGKKWKLLHRLVYLGTIATFWHWLLFASNLQSAQIWLAILVVAKAIQLGMLTRRKHAAI
ncbi:MAG: ferric reductase-like transmembrane domain-containing protein [Rhodobacterales bacterium]